MQDKCDTRCVCVCVLSARVGVCLFGCVLALAFFYGFATPPDHVRVFVYVRVCASARDEHVVPAGGKKIKKMARSRTMCHNYVQGVTAKAAPKPFEAVFTDTNIQIEHHIGVRSPPLPLSPPHSLTTFSPHPLWPWRLCLPLPVCINGACASTVNVCSVCPISSSLF